MKALDVVGVLCRGDYGIDVRRNILFMKKLLTWSGAVCRGDYGIDVGRNIIHGSDSVDVRLLCSVF